MEAIHSAYDFNKSIERIDEILGLSDSTYEDRKQIPSRDSLTFSNGFYVSCSALFVDIRRSKALGDKHTRPVLAKIYKTFISELVAVLKDHSKVSEIYIEGDCVWGVFNTPFKSDIDSIVDVAAKISSLVDVLNIKYKKKGYSELTVGIGASYGESLMIKSGYKGSSINEVVWLGKLVGEAALLCSYGNSTFSDGEIMVSNVLYENLNEENKKFFKINTMRSCYQANIVNTKMNEWVENNG